MTIAAQARRSQPSVRPEVAVLASLPAGPELCAALACIDISKVSGYEMVLVLRARARQGNYERGMFLAAVAETIRRTDPEQGRLCECELSDRRKWNVAELRCALGLTRTAAARLAGLADDLSRRLPAVLAAMVDGRLDQPRARVFSTWTEQLADRHTDEIVKHLLPRAPRMTTGELIEAIQKAAIELDPRWARRRYGRALGKRQVKGVLRPDGTADLTGSNLPADQVAAACDRLDALAHRLKQAGYPSLLSWIRADIYLGKLDGRYEGLSDDQLFEHLMANPVPQPAPDPEPLTPDDLRTPEEEAEYLDYLIEHGLFPDLDDLPGDDQESDPDTDSDSGRDDSDHPDNDGPGGENHDDDPSGSDGRDGGAGNHGAKPGERDADGHHEPDGPTRVPGHGQLRRRDHDEHHDRQAAADQGGSEAGQGDERPEHDDHRAHDSHTDGEKPDHIDRSGRTDEPPDHPPGLGVVGPRRPDDDTGGGSAQARPASTSDAACSDRPGLADSPDPPPITDSAPRPGSPAADLPREADPPPVTDSRGTPAVTAGRGRTAALRPADRRHTHATPNAGGEPAGRPGSGAPVGHDPVGGVPAADAPNGPGDLSGDDRPALAAPDPRRVSPAVFANRQRGRVRGRGLRLLVGLTTLAGVDRRPGQLVGFGFVHAELARRISAAPAARWCYALVHPDGTPIQVGLIRRRPTRPWADGPIPDYQQLEVWLQLTPDELTQLVDTPPDGWQSLIHGLAKRITAARRCGAPTSTHPDARLPGRLLRRWLHLRDRRCVFPGCRIAPHHSDADHTTEYARGGLTTAANIGTLCRPDHRLRHDHGWRVHQPRPGQFTWTSPLGHHYQRTPPPAPADTLTPMDRPIRICEDPVIVWVNGDLGYRGTETCKIIIPPPPPPKPPPTPLGDPPF